MATPRLDGAFSGGDHRPVSSQSSRGRGGRGRGRDQTGPGAMRVKSRSSEPSEGRGNQGKHPSRGGRGGGNGGRNGGRGGQGKAWIKHKSSRSGQQAEGVLSLLPEDIVTQSLLPFLVWHDTSAIACVCKQWSDAVRHGRQQHSEWKTHVFQGDNTRECLAKLSRSLARGAREVGSVRFPPTFALATLSFADVQANARYAESFWSDLVDSVVAQDVVPVGCVLVGLLTGHQTRGLDEDAEHPDSSVSLTVSMGHFANTTVETAAFDRKVLRWSASGLTEELECPFPLEGNRESELDKTSLLLWSKNAKPAQALLELSSQWFPGAPVGGGVLSLGDHAPPLMTFTRAARAEPKRSKLQGRRKPKTTTLSGGGVMSCPSTLLLRLRGDVRVTPFSLCLDRPITPILKNVGVASIDELELMRDDWQVYNAVAVVDGETDRARHDQSASLLEVIRALTRTTLDQSTFDQLVGLKIYSSPSPADLRVAFGANEVPVVSTMAWESDRVKPLPLFLGESAAITFGDHWPRGSCGVVTEPFNNDVMSNAADAQVENVVKMSTDRHVFGAFAALSKDAAKRNLRMASSRRVFDRTPWHESIVDDGVAPLLLPSGIIGAKSQLLVGTSTGFLLHH